MKAPATPLSTPRALYPHMTALITGLVLSAMLMLSQVFAAEPVDTHQASTQVDNRIYASLLAQHVRKNRVDYDGFKRDEALLDSYLKILSSIDSDQLSPQDQFAFFINAYNAFTIKLILTKYPGINSIKEVGSFFSNPWSKKFISLNGHKVSLDYIEHEVLRPKFKDARVHFAINCAAKSCPPLFDQPFDGKQLDAQLDKRTSKFINDISAVYLKENTLYISKIFKWFAPDFNGTPLMFIKRYATGDFKTRLATNNTIKISYLPYDWTLNRR